MSNRKLRNIRPSGAFSPEVTSSPKETSSSAAAAVAAIALKFHPKHVTNKNKAKHMKISHINVNIYDKTATSQQNSD
jgi:hypothetical protein